MPPRFRKRLPARFRSVRSWYGFFGKGSLARPPHNNGRLRPGVPLLCNSECRSAYSGLRPSGKRRRNPAEASTWIRVASGPIFVSALSTKHSSRAGSVPDAVGVPVDPDIPFTASIRAIFPFVAEMLPVPVPPSHSMVKEPVVLFSVCEDSFPPTIKKNRAQRVLFPSFCLD